MNPHDRDNLNYIMGLDDDQFDAWSLGLTKDDIQYAIEIIRARRVELADQEQSLMEADLEESNFAEANAVLQKFML